VPPATGFLPLDFAPGNDTLDARAEEQLALSAWALQRWSVGEVGLAGLAKRRTRSDLALERRRVARVREWLAAHGIAVQMLPGDVRSGSSKRVSTAGETDTHAVEIILPQKLTIPPART